MEEYDEVKRIAELEYICSTPVKKRDRQEVFVTIRRTSGDEITFRFPDSKDGIYFAALARYSSDVEASWTKGLV